MTAKGKINASNLQVNDRILIDTAVVNFDGNVHPGVASTKTGKSVTVARVTSKARRDAQGMYERRGKYIIETTAGTIEAAPIQTMWLAPEDPAGIKRAYAEALAENEDRKAEAVRAAESAREAELADAEAVAHRERIEAAEAAEATPVVAGPTPSRERAAQTAGRVLRPFPYADPASEAATAQREQTEGWLARHRRLGTLRTQVTPMEDARLADHAEALVINRTLDQLTLDSQACKVDDMSENSAPAASPATVQDHTGSTVVSLLERVWARIRQHHAELPEIVIVTGSGLVGGSKWGHFRAEGWKLQGETAERKHELFLAGEALAKGAAQTLQTMLHEAAHTLAKVRGQQDTSRQGRWHNAVFRKTAEELGLEHRSATGDKTHGFSFVTLTEATRERYADLLAELDREIQLVCHLPGWLGGSDEPDRGGEKITGKAPGEGEKAKTKNGGNVKAVCECDEPNIIRLSPKVLDKRLVRCDECESLFRAAD